MSQTTTGKIIFVSAGAGSGKTHRLTELLHEELSSGRARASGVIATTFTRKAAAELRERVRTHLYAEGEFALATAMGEARIGTVNGVCGQLISRFAFEAGIALEQQVLEEAQAKVLVGKAIDAVVSEVALGRMHEVTRRLALEDDWRDDVRSIVDQVRANDIDPARLAGFAQDNANALLGHFPPPSADDPGPALIARIDAALPGIEALALDKGRKNTKDYLALLRDFKRDLARNEAPWSLWVKLAKQRPEKALEAVADELAEDFGRVFAHPGLHADIRSYLELCFGLAERALDAYAQIKRETGVLDFADQEHLLLTLLDEPAVAEVLADELDLLMVDEFQDTSPIQLALFMKLARLAKRVYWVGDIKQAIYGFRGSDTELMCQIIAALPAIGGSKEVLPSSWRSRPELVRLVNAVFVPAFADELARDEVALTPQREPVLDGPAFANWILNGKNKALQQEALAHGIRQLVASGHRVLDKGATVPRPVRYGDIAVLVRMNTDVTAIAAAPGASGGPCATAQPGLLATPEARLALACLRRLNDPADTVATAEIVSMADGEDPERWVAERLRYLASGAPRDQWRERELPGHAAHPLVAALAQARGELSVLAPKEAMQRVIALGDLPRRVLCWSPDPQLARQRLANLEALLALAGDYEDLCAQGQHAASVSGLILWLAQQADDATDSLAQPGIDAVRVLTHHGAKGLEWPVVVLTDLAANVKDRIWGVSARGLSDFDPQDPLRDRFIRHWPWPFGAQKSLGLCDQVALSREGQALRAQAIAEAKRLLYVSMTRARDLMVFARAGKKSSGEWLECVDAPWLMPEDDPETLVLPDGEKQPAMYRELAPAEVAAEPAATANLRWCYVRYSVRSLPRNCHADGEAERRTAA